MASCITSSLQHPPWFGSELWNWSKSQKNHHEYQSRRNPQHQWSGIPSRRLMWWWDWKLTSNKRRKNFSRVFPVGVRGTPTLITTGDLFIKSVHTLSHPDRSGSATDVLEIKVEPSTFTPVHAYRASCRGGIVPRKLTTNALKGWTSWSSIGWSSPSDAWGITTGRDIRNKSKWQDNQVSDIRHLQNDLKEF